MKKTKIWLTMALTVVCAGLLGFSAACGESSADHESQSSSFMQEESVNSESSEVVESSEEVISSEVVESSEEVISSEEVESSDEAISSEEAESSEEVISSKEVESSEEAVSSEEAESSEEAIFSEEVESSDEVISSEEAESSEDAISSEEVVSSDEVISSEEVESSEEAISSEEAESSEEEQRPSGVLEGEAPAGTFYQLGDVMYDFTVTTSDGATFTLSEVLKEKELVVINFWATWCPPCKAEFPAMNAVLLEYGDSVDCIAISVSDSNEEVQAFKSSNGYSFKMAAVGAGNNLENLFGVYAIPHTIMVDRYGVIVFNETGARTDASFWRNTFDKYIGEDYQSTSAE